jgi:Carboxypeptidase regulatory-like domain
VAWRREITMLAALGVAGLFGAGISRAGSVEVLSCEAASQRAQVAVDLAGQPAKDVKVELRAFNARLVGTLKTDGSGRVALPQLKAGKYIVTARGTNQVVGSICVEVGKQNAQLGSSFTIAMKALAPAGLPLELPKQRVERFRGTVVDQTGAGVAGARIVIVPTGSSGARQRKIVKTDKVGGFFLELADGKYSASFEGSGFRTVMMDFEVARGGSSDELRVVLPVGLATE